eukprot:TRINITY_DN1066_c0_g1_i1.p1 TRINITY_DN1066_c0_g1~~TRINITY_DN1066_c0_g1_i1.p1  ORF type:complete len:155 (+),score=46.06 TRINITY_DN1066_c0_g1_i1:36-467(+)
MAEEKPKKVYTLEEVSQHSKEKDCWLILHGKVYDVSKYLDEHPGGDEVMLAATGQDATDDFENVGHSTSARKLLEEFYIGEFDSSSLGTSESKSKAGLGTATQGQTSETSFVTKILQFLVPLAILGLAVAVRYLTKKDRTVSS